MSNSAMSPCVQCGAITLDLCRERHVAKPRKAGERGPRLVVARRKGRIIKHRNEHAVDEITHRRAAAAMGQCDRWHADAAAVPDGDGNAEGVQQRRHAAFVPFF